MSVVYVLLILAAIQIPCLAKAEDLTADMEKVLDGVDFASVSELYVHWPGGDTEMGVEDAVRMLAGGEGFSPEAALHGIFKAFLGAFGRMGPLAVSVMLPVLLSGMVMQAAPGRSGNEMLRCTLAIIVLAPMVWCVLGEMEHVKRSITQTTERMDGMMPLLFTLLTAVGGNASSAFLHPVVAAASGSMVYLAREVILRLVMCTCAITTINHLSDRAHLTRLARLMRSIVCWLLGVGFTVFLGAMSVQGVCSASADGIAIRAAKYAVDNFVPVVGGMFSDTMDTLIGCTIVVKNALGVTAMLILAGVIAGPMIRTAAAAIVLRICAALLEPAAPAETVNAIGDFADTLVLFLITMLCVGTMYFLLIVQLLLVGNLTVLLR